MSAPLAYHGLPSGLSDGRSPRLQLRTPSGLIREVPLSRQELTRLAAAAIRAIEYLDRGEGLYQ